MVEFTPKEVFYRKNFYRKRTQEDGHFRENPSNPELLAVRGVDCRVSVTLAEHL